MPGDKTQPLTWLGVLLLLSAIAAWLQFGMLGDAPPDAREVSDAAPDYRINDFDYAAVDADGVRYRIIARSLAHYPLDDRALLQDPQVIRRAANRAPQHIRADSGWLYDDHEKIELSGNVRIIETVGDEQHTAQVGRMTIHLNAP